jgi:multiple sugar transport system ATP-binding protein
MGFSLKLRGAPKTEIDSRVNRAADILGLKPLLERFPRQLSGGQRQRVAMGRAIVRDPQVFLFDEPLSNLDAKLRVAMRTEIKELHQRLKTTTVYVTHDQIEAMTMADKIVVMHDGIVEQIGTPLELYDKPDNQFVAGFIGSPAMNFLHGKVRTNGSAGFDGPNGVRLPLAALPPDSEGRPAVYGIRPEHFTIADDGAEAEIVVVEPTGSETQVFAKLGGEEVVAVFRERHKFEPGDKVRLKPDPALVHLFDEATGKRLNA